MPQLDKFTYFSQFFRLCLILFSFYIAIWNDGDGVLGINNILKLRNQLLSHQENKIQSKDPKTLEDISKKVFTQVSPICTPVYSKYPNWLYKMISSTLRELCESNNRLDKLVRNLGKGLAIPAEHTVQKAVQDYANSREWDAGD